jgi:hypothetical protein
MIIAPAKANEKSMPKTFAGLLRSTLGGGKPAIGGAKLYEQGEAKWFSSKQAKMDKGTRGQGTGDRGQESGVRDEGKTSLAPVAKRRERSWERVSPSSLEGGVRVAGATILAARSPVALGIGTLFHAWLAEIKWLDDGLPSDETLRRIAARVRAESGASADEVAAHIARFRQQLAAKPIAELLSRKFYESPANLGLKSKAWPAGGIELTALRERSFAIRQDDALLAGSIDRLVVIKSGGKPIAADVIDFKTDEIAAGDKKALAARVEFYRPQMEAYRAAAARLLGLAGDRIAARLVFLSSGGAHGL